MKFYNLPLPVNLQLDYDVIPDGDFDDLFGDDFSITGGVAVMAVMTEGITTDPQNVTREIMDSLYGLGRFSIAASSWGTADVWVKLCDVTGKIYEVDLHEFESGAQVAIVGALRTGIGTQENVDH